MRKVRLTITSVCLSVFAMTNAYTQPIPVIEDRTTPIVEPLRLNGPRLGYVFNLEADFSALERYSSYYEDPDNYPSPFVSVFGWQYEWQYFSTPDGSVGLIEFIPMISGFDQGLILPSANILFGFRTSSGKEVAFGPNMSVFGSAMVMAFGHTFSDQYVNFPVNVAFIRGRDTFRIALTFGFNKRSREVR